MPQVSVIVPNYNHANFLDKRLKSILNQTFKDFELIILDDCSLDNSKEVIERYRSESSVTQIIYNQVNSGSTFKQWEKGIDLANGEFIWIAESDDYSELTFLAEAMMAFALDENIIVSFCQSLYVTEDGRIMHKTNADLIGEVVDGKNFIARKMLGANSIPNASMAVFRKSKLKTISNDYIEMRYCGDWLFWVNLILQGKVYISGKYLNYYFRHNNNVATGAQKKGLDFLEGNKIFIFICALLEISKIDRVNALKIKIDEYLQLRSTFLNNEIRKEVLDSILELDPLSKNLLRKRIAEIKRAKYFSAVKKLFTIYPGVMLTLN